MTFDDAAIAQALGTMDEAAFDELPFGVLGVNDEGTVEIYNAHKERYSGLSRDSVMDRHFFSDVALCMNNYLMAERLEEASLDVTLPYVLTFRMRPTRSGSACCMRSGRRGAGSWSRVAEMKPDLELASEHESLLQFLYLCPHEMAQFDTAGTISLLNPAFSCLTMPLLPPGETFGNLIDLLEPCLPELRSLMQSPL